MSKFIMKYSKKNRAEEKLRLSDGIARIPPIIGNGLLKICHCGDASGDFEGCVEDEVALEVFQ